MVFKAVQGVVPPQGGLRQLWTSSDTLNSDKPSAQTLTRSPNLVYKSANVEKWQSIPGFFIESVRWRKLSFFFLLVSGSFSFFVITQAYSNVTRKNLFLYIYLFTWAES